MAPLRLFRLDLLAYAAARATVIQFWMTGAQNTTAYRRQLPFEDAAFEVVVNVEASHVYSDERLFFREAHRVLRPGGPFLFADFRTRRHACDLEVLLRQIGFEGKLHDITRNVARACALDSGRRMRLIQTAAPRYYRPLIVHLLQRYACVEGTRRLEKFRNRRDIYLISCMIKQI
jgi:ubiquinone/menaquinone biosynthesis C-methylase UbiE